MKHPNRIFDRYKRSTGGSRTSQQPPPSSTLMQSHTHDTQTARLSASRERSPQQQYQYSSQQTGQSTVPSFNSTHAREPIDPPTGEPQRNTAVQRNVVPPLTSTQAPNHRQSPQSHFGQSNAPMHRWIEHESKPGTTGNEVSNQRIGNANTSSNGRQTYDHSNRRDSNDNGEFPYTTSTTSNIHRITGSHHPASAIVSPNNEDDDDHLPSSISSRLSFEPWESVVQPPPFIHESMSNSNNYYNYPSASATERRYNNYTTDIHEPLYNYRNRHSEYYNYHSERVLPTHGFNDTPSHHQWASVESEHTRQGNRSVGGYGSTGPTTTTTTTTPTQNRAVTESTTMIEITPGNMARLRDANETITAIQNDFYVPCTCVYCDITSMSPSYMNNQREPIFCIQDAEYFLCPTCASINRLDVDNSNGHSGNNTSSSSSSSSRRNGAFRMVGGVGLGFTMKTLLEVQRDYISKYQN